MEVRLEYSITSSDTRGFTKLTVDDWEQRTVGDLKLAIQDSLYAPRCDQRLFYQGRSLENDSCSLASLYFRQGDHMKVCVPSEADIERCNTFLREIKRFFGLIKNDFKTSLELFLKDLHDGDSVNYYRVREALVRTWFPWKNVKSLANRRYIVQEGGLEMFMAIFRFSLQKFEDLGRSDEMAKERSEMDDQLRVNSIDHLNRHQTDLTMSCLHFLWNFSETGEETCLILQRGALPLIMEVLAICFPIRPSREVDDLWQLSLGCLAGCVEFDAVSQETVVKNEEAMKTLLLLLLRGIQSHPGYSSSVSMFTSQLAASSLFYCSYNLKTHSVLLSSGVHQKVINCCKKLFEVDGNLLLRYYCVLFLAMLRSSPVVELSVDLCHATDSLSVAFLDRHTPEELVEWEKEHDNVWMTTVPLVSLAFAGGRVQHNLPVNKEHVSDCSCTCSCNCIDTSLKDNSATNICITEENENLRHSGVLTYVAPEMPGQELGAELMVTVSERDVNGSKQHESNSASISASCVEHKTCRASCIPFDVVARYPGSVAIQKLGMFTLRQLLAQDENYKLIQDEKLIPYLVCFCWGLEKEDKQFLHGVFRKHSKYLELPSLGVIAKSVLAQMYGFQVALKM